MSRKTFSPTQFLQLSQEPNCKPLDTYDEILSFAENPPSWRSLCQEITPHSKDKIRNMSLNTLVGVMGPDRPPTFCHFSQDSEDVERQSADFLPRTLVCHDMANGYHDDSMIDGTSNHLAYSFYHWAAIDIFCYFSHHLVTIPPLGWINVGHAHGVKVIGTIITEWSEGADFWEYVLSSESQYQELADALVSIAKLLKFDGWLLNVENKVTKPLVLVDFVKYLHQKLHEELDEPVLIWYDSVTIKGNLNWQNGLNEHNKDFFDACDGIFTNYSWREEDIANSADIAGDRLNDLYIGVDVWGRNFYGGGQFNTAEAVELASGYGCSLAIFAPAWTYETAERRDADIALADHLDAAQHLQLRERALWGSLWPYLNTNLPCTLPFQTSFCRGNGTKRRLYGEVLSPGPWYNLRHMQYQPNSAYGPHGYLLSTPERITAVARNAVIRDKKGIIKYHTMFEQSRQELHTVRSTRELENMQRKHHDSMIICTIDDEERRAREHEEEDKKHSMKNVFKHMFRIKSRRRSEDNDDEAQDHSHTHDDAHNHTQNEVQDKTQDPTSDKTEDPTEDKTQDSISHKTKDPTDGKTQDIKSDNTAETHDGHHVKIQEHKDQDDNTLETHDEVNVKTEVQSHDKSVDQSHNKSHDKSHVHIHEHDHALHSYHDLKSGWSLRQMSVNIKLGSQPKSPRLALACVPGEKPCLEPYYHDSYIGGSSLIIYPSDQVYTEHRWIRLLHCEFPCSGDLVICVVTKVLPGYEQQYLNVKLFARDTSERELRVTCVGRSLPSLGAPSSAALTASGALSLYPLPERDLKALQKYLLLNEPGFYMSVENSYGWKVRYYLAPLGSAVVTSVNLVCGHGAGPVLLGHVGLCLRREDIEDASSWIDDRPRLAREAHLGNHNTGLTTTKETSSGSNIKTMESDSPYWSPRTSEGVNTDTPRNSLMLENLNIAASTDTKTVDYVTPRNFKTVDKDSSVTSWDDKADNSSLTSVMDDVRSRRSSESVDNYSSRSSKDSKSEVEEKAKSPRSSKAAPGSAHASRSDRKT